MRATESGKEVVKRILVSNIDCGKCETPSITFTFEQVVVTHGNIEQVARRDAGRMMVIILGVRSRHLKETGTELRYRASKCRNSR